jgi:hypothetical protein
VPKAEVESAKVDFRFGTQSRQRPNLVAVVFDVTSPM